MNVDCVSVFSVVKEKNILAMSYTSSAIPVTLREAFQKKTDLFYFTIL